MSAVAIVVHVKDLAELRGILPAKGKEAEAWIRGGSARYWWDASSTAADDGNEVVKPSAIPDPDPEEVLDCACDMVTGAGRWLKMPCCASTASGTASFEAENKDVAVASQGMAVAMHSSGVGVVKASAADNSKHAVGLAAVAIAVGVAGAVLTEGLLSLPDWTAVTGSAALVAKATYFLDPSTPGRLTSTAPSAAGQVVQIVGREVAPDTLEIEIEPPILL